MFVLLQNLDALVVYCFFIWCKKGKVSEIFNVCFSNVSYDGLFSSTQRWLCLLYRSDDK